MQKPYDYKKAIKQDIRTYIRTYVDIDYWDNNWPVFRDYLWSVLLFVDSVTGNSSGSYTKDAQEARENLLGNEDLFEQAQKESDADMLLRYNYQCRRETDPERQDVMIRCFLLDECIVEVIGEIVTNENLRI